MAEILPDISKLDPLAHALAASPELFPHALDLRSGTVTLLRLSRADYEQASFLDQRIAGPSKPGRSLPFPVLVRAVGATQLCESCHFIFHIGHVGSTLLSRLLGSHPALFSLREPEILRTLAQAPDGTSVEPYLAALLKLYSRTFDPGARAVVKASSFVSDLAPQILARRYAPKALVMGVAPETWLATIFGGENAPAEARALAPFRLARLRKRLGCNWRPADLGEAELIALGWACEASALAAAKEAAGARVLVIDFDSFLAEPDAGLCRAFLHFGARVGEDEIAKLLSGPQMRTYSKAPEHAYDAALRRSVLAQARALFGPEIRRGLSWIERACAEFPVLGSALALFDRAPQSPLAGLANEL